MRSNLMLGADVIAMSGARAQSGLSPGDVAEPAIRFDEIVVTAQARSENIQTVPIAITTLSGEALQPKRIENISDLGPTIPNVVVSGASSIGNAAASFFIRGIGPERSTHLHTGFNCSVVRPGNYGYIMVSPRRPAEYYLTLSTKV